MFTLDELMAWTDEETTRWEAWFRERDLTVLELPVGAGDREPVRSLIAHIFIVEHRYADRLLGDEPVAYAAFPAMTIDEIFAIHGRARGRLRQWTASATPAEMDERLTFPTITAGEFTASKRKIAAHALLHGVRHWAQIATVLRQAGHPQPWMHDLLASSALE